MKMRNIALTALCLMALSETALAGCTIHYNRTTCPGQQKESYSNCNGKVFRAGSNFCASNHPDFNKCGG